MYPIPTLDQCVQRVRASFRSNLKGTDATLWPNNIVPTGKVVGGTASEIYQKLDFAAQQAFVLFAVGKYLEAHGADYGLVRRPAAPASGTLIVTAPDAVAFANGAQFRRSDGVVVVAAIGGALAQAGSLGLAVVATTSAAATNSDAGAPFAILSGASGPGAATATAVADSNGLTGGLDIEPDGPKRSTSLATLRGRILFRKRNPPQGGAPHDYVAWASAVPGVTRVFVERYPNGPGTLRVYPIFDGLFASAGGIADPAHVALVEAAVAGQQPAATEVTVLAPTAFPVPVTVQGLVPNTTPVQAAVLAELTDTFQRLGRVAGADPASAGIQAALPFLATPFSFAAIWVDQAVANATGEKRAVVTTPPADIVVPAGNLPVLQGPVFA